ncbi:hypothetical protein [Sporolactobacillus sp. CQH2019]|uniref:hypothetical protein n=1 Tax=Sporolactobacillus sp. CQH2019 TaxID=3023512 RepID=UPI002367989E|nr:hypothetical protein [Sporolactobacillus sp. CQH2019]
MNRSAAGARDCSLNSIVCRSNRRSWRMNRERRGSPGLFAEFDCLSFKSGELADDRERRGSPGVISRMAYVPFKSGGLSARYGRIRVNDETASAACHF